MTHSCEVAIVGGGMAGATLALLLHVKRVWRRKKSW